MCKRNANDGSLTCAHAQDLAVSGSAGWAATVALVLLVRIPLPVIALLAGTLARWVKETRSGQAARVGE